MTTVDRGHIVYLDFDPQVGHEQAGRRPGIVLSPKLFNQSTGFAVLCPITRQKKGYPFEVVLPAGLAVEGVILTDQVKSLDWRARRIQIQGKAPNQIVNDCLDKIHTFL
jgi:mRNA interferase MazF